MATSSGFEKWGEHPRRLWHLDLIQNLRTGLTGWDILTGFCAAVVFSIILIGVHFQTIPEYEEGQIADQDIRVDQDVSYIDQAATNLRRAETEIAIPAVYQLEAGLISGNVQSISSAFSDARDILAESETDANSRTKHNGSKDLIAKLKKQTGEVFPENILQVLLRCNFSPDLENRMLKILDDVLRDGVIADRGEFLNDARSGIVFRDDAMSIEHPLTDAWQRRDLSAAKEFLRQSRLDFPKLSAKEQSLLIQYLESRLIPTLVCNREETNERRAQAAARVRPVEARIKQGQIIVRSGEQITPRILQQLNAIRDIHKPRSLLWQAVGYFLIIAILLYTFWRYLFLYQARRFRIRQRMALILCVIAFQLIVMRLSTSLADILSERFQSFDIPFVLYYGIPFTFGTLLITLLTDVNLGMISAGFFTLITGMFFGGTDIVVYCMIGCIAGIYSIRQYKDRAAILKSGMTIGIVNIICLIGLCILRQTSIRFSDFLSLIVLTVLSGGLASMLVSLLLPALEYFFKMTTDVRLLELSNLNAPILRRLAIEAPGTYQHSQMVAILTETAAESIGANPLLARVASYYHDIGKLRKPDYFVENQGYHGNRHEELSPSLSCLIISSHVKDGLGIAKSVGLPPRICEMIPQHHGTRVMTYFYKKALDSAIPDKNKIMEEDFRYPGPKPQSREAAILMMADSIEAASRTMDDPVPTQIQGMIDRIVDDIISDGQFDDCDITLGDIRIAKDSFFKILAGAFHHRIDYPGYDFKNKNGTHRSEPDSSAEPAKAR